MIIICFLDLLEDRWNTLQCKAVLEAIRHVMYTKLGFHGNKDDYYDINNSFIDKVSVYYFLLFNILFEMMGHWDNLVVVIISFCGVVGTCLHASWP